MSLPDVRLGTRSSLLNAGADDQRQRRGVRDLLFLREFTSVP